MITPGVEGVIFPPEVGVIEIFETLRYLQAVQEAFTNVYDIAI